MIEDEGILEKTRCDVPVRNGQGFALNNGWIEPVELPISGEVDQVCENLVSLGWHIMGNSTPCSIDLTKIVPVKTDDARSPLPTTGRAACAGQIYIQILDGEGNYEKTLYSYYSNKSLVGWYYKKDGVDVQVTSMDVPLKAGEAFAINNGWTDPVYIQLPNPTETK